jgi:hypothetical protein
LRVRSCEKIRNHKNRWLQVVDYQSAHFAVLSIPSIFSQLLRHGAPKQFGMEQERHRAVAWSRLVGVFHCTFL